MSAKEESIPSNAQRCVIFTYSIEHLSKTDKVRFYYALKGRDGKSGIVKAWNVEQLGRAVLLAQSRHEPHVANFLKFWKCAFDTKEVWTR